MRTFFQDFTLDSGTKVTAEYSYSAGSPDTYSPRFGAEGGDPCEVSILKVMPSTRIFDWLCHVSLALTYGSILHRVVCAPLHFLEWWHFPGTTERERMEEWIIDHVTHDDDYYEEDFREA